MVTFFEACLEQLSIHRTGNKLQNEFYVLSENPLEIQDDTLKKLLMHYFLSAFEKVNEVYRFMHSSSDLNLNEAYHFCSMIFSDPSSFHEHSMNITKHLFNVSNHPKIKSGEVYISIFKDLQIEG